MNKRTVKFLFGSSCFRETIFVELPEIYAEDAIQKIKTDDNYHYFDGSNFTSINFNKDINDGFDVIARIGDFAITRNFDKKHLIEALQDYSNAVRWIEAKKN